MSKPSNGPMKTLVKQPPPHAAQAPIENALELTELGVIAPVSTSIPITKARDWS